MAPAPGVRFENTYARELEGLYVPWRGTDFPDPRVVQLNRALAEELGLDPDFLAGADGAALLAGSRLPEDTTPLAQAYAGHQFGGFSPQLGDGRALLVGELVDGTGRRWDLHLKGSGATPFSRGGDGKAVLGPVLREYLIGESMYALGVPTTRALAVVTTGERVRRQDGPEPGAVLARIASSHLRVGTFQFFAARGEGERVRQLADYAIRRHFPGLAESGEPYLDLFRAVRDRQATLVAKWMAVGFVHGVMNTDNMTISGETIDYGPCAFVDAYDPAAVFSSIDRGGRYAYGNQPSIALWNLARFAETLLHLIDPESTKGAVEKVRGELEDFPVQHRLAWLAEMRGKLGLERADPGDADLIDALLSILTRERADFTGTFRALADVLRGDRQPLRALLADPQALDEWIEGWEARIALEGTTYPAPTDRAAAMDRVNPLYIPRNHKVEEALQAASRGLDFGPFERLLEAVTDPFRKRAGFEVYEEPAPPGFGPYTTFCGT